MMKMNLTKKWKDIGYQVYGDVAGGKENPSLVLILMVITMLVMVAMMMVMVVMTMVRKVMMMISMAVHEVADWDDDDSGIDDGCLGLVKQQPT